MEEQRKRPDWVLRHQQARQGDQARADNPRQGFWIFPVLAGLMVLGAVLTYLYEETFYTLANETRWPFLILLSGFVIAALFFVLCFRMTPLGQRLLDRRPESEGKRMVSHLTFGFETESGADEARQSSRRVHARHARRAALKHTPTKRDPDE